jgi:hypothetical protein
MKDYNKETTGVFEAPKEEVESTGVFDINDISGQLVRVKSAAKGLNLLVDIKDAEIVRLKEEISKMKQEREAIEFALVRDETILQDLTKDIRKALNLLARKK